MMQTRIAKTKQEDTELGDFMRFTSAHLALTSRDRYTVWNDEGSHLLFDRGDVRKGDDQLFGGNILSEPVQLAYH
jgi:hypothetical protein